MPSTRVEESSVTQDHAQASRPNIYGSAIEPNQEPEERGTGIEEGPPTASEAPDSSNDMEGSPPYLDDSDVSSVLVQFIESQDPVSQDAITHQFLRIRAEDDDASDLETLSTIFEDPDHHRPQTPDSHVEDGSQAEFINDENVPPPSNFNSTEASEPSHATTTNDSLDSNSSSGSSGIILAQPGPFDSPRLQPSAPLNDIFDPDNNEDDGQWILKHFPRYSRLVNHDPSILLPQWKFDSLSAYIAYERDYYEHKFAKLNSGYQERAWSNWRNWGVPLEEAVKEAVLFSEREWSNNASRSSRGGARGGRGRGM